MSTSSKFFRVATEGATTDGRNIDRAWIDQIAKNFNRAKYGARVWLEHIRGVLPDSQFKAYGDVIAVEARDVEEGKRALFAQIEPLPELIAMNKAKQKLYTSIEVTPKFGDTGEAYLTGLAITDSLASLGTEVLAFAQQKPEASPFKGRKSHPDALFSEAVALDLELEDDDDTSIGAKFSQGLKTVLAKVKGQGKSTDARFADVVAGFEELGAVFAEQAEQHSQLQTSHDKLSRDFAALKAEHEGLVQKLEGTPSQQHKQRPAATGGAGFDKTDC